MSHHQNLGQYSLAQVFDSDQNELEDGDVLFVGHRMKLTGDYGPAVTLPFGNKKVIKMSLARAGFSQWQEGQAVGNAIKFAASFLGERVMLAVNDVVVAVTGRNFFFPHKPAAFHRSCARYARAATLLRAGLWYGCGWRSLLFLFLSETLWSVPPHPACAMFVSNHGSQVDPNGNCIPTASTYAGRWYSVLTLGTNYHCEHHDFPTIPLDRLGRLRQIAPEYYRAGSNDNLRQIMHDTFAHPEFYACMSANGLLADSTAQPKPRTTTTTVTSAP